LSRASTSLDSHKFWPLPDRQSFLVRNELLDRKDLTDRRSCWSIACVPAKSTSTNADIGNPFPTKMPQRKISRM
jgi:hypothetical protein